ncbi:RNA polymerase sigma factor [Microbacterium sp. MYb62]|uniref:RNA polymerase sigma factor n=1 Tax=Microbacterium sp. MYb62 TaxID=1848690 RepID=UPI000CFE06C3|nr:RNA polymerase sigma factor [Microbacterium sp. MYb62]PRB09963.1 RNA polymerase subunit sigma-24 [Microbacterium sp. MYb62]
MNERQSRGVDHISTNSADLLAYFEHRARGAEAADLLSETMATAWRRVDAMPEDSTHARMWLFGIARNVLANAARGAQRRWKLADRLRAHLVTAAPPDDDQRAVEVRDAVSRLPPDLRELIGLIHWDGFSITDAAGIIGIPASTARTRYQTARRQLARSLDPVGPASDGGNA